RVRDAIPVFNMAFLSADVYFEHSIPELLPKGYARLEGDAQLKEVGLKAAALYDNDSGYYAAVYSTGDGNYAYVNRGTGDIKDWINNFIQGMGGDSKQYDRAIKN